MGGQLKTLLEDISDARRADPQFTPDSTTIEILSSTPLPTIKYQSPFASKDPDAIISRAIFHEYNNSAIRDGQNCTLTEFMTGGGRLRLAPKGCAALEIQRLANGIYSICSDEIGSHIHINAATHGNEPCGAHAAVNTVMDMISGQLALTSGLMILTVGNPDALRANKRGLDGTRW